MPVTDTVDTQSVAYDEMAQDGSWRLIDHLLGGTSAMRAAREEYLPKEPRENIRAYDVRLNRSFLFNAFKDTIKRLTSKPFASPVSLKGEETLDDRLQGIKDNTDRRGTSLTELAKKSLREGITWGLCHILVDFPIVLDPESVTRNTEDRPNFVFVSPRNLIGWKVDGSGELSEIRIQEFRTEPVGSYGDQKVKYIRVYRKADWELHRESPSEQGDFIMVGAGGHTFGKVPLFTFYADQTGQLTGMPPLLDLAWENLQHWQSNSDQRNILRFARFGILFGRGFEDRELKQLKAVGPTNYVAATNPEASLEVVEHTGKAIGAGQEDLDRIEQRMTVLGLRPVVGRSGNVTATGKVIDEANTLADVQAWVGGIETLLFQCYEAAASWFRISLPSDFSVNIADEFTLSPADKEEVNVILKAAIANKISNELLIQEMIRRGILADTVDVGEELERIESQGPNLFRLGEEEEGTDAE